MCAFSQACGPLARWQQLLSTALQPGEDGGDLPRTKFEDEAVVGWLVGKGGDALVEVALPGLAGLALGGDEGRDDGRPLAGGAGELRQEFQAEVAPMLHGGRHPGGICG